MSAKHPIALLKACSAQQWEGFTMATKTTLQGIHLGT